MESKLRVRDYVLEDKVTYTYCDSCWRKLCNAFEICCAIDGEELEPEPEGGPEYDGECEAHFLNELFPKEVMS